LQNRDFFRLKFGWVEEGRARMKVLKRHSNYLIDQMKHEKRQANYDKVLYILFLMGSLALFLGYVQGQVFSGNQDRLVLIFSLVLLIAALNRFQTGKQHNIQSLKYKKGMLGEASVTEELQNLDNNYFLIDDLKLKGKSGNIDHIILGPNGIFVVETKGFGGYIGCNGDEWTRRATGSSSVKDLESPSLQVRKNAAEIKQLLLSARDLVDEKSIFVDGIVLFTDSGAHLELKSPTIPVLRLGDLCSHIKNFKSADRYSSRELESIADYLLDHAD
jgi:hypothetical protein